MGFENMSLTFIKLNARRLKCVKYLSFSKRHFHATKLIRVFKIYLVKWQFQSDVLATGVARHSQHGCPHNFFRGGQWGWWRKAPQRGQGTEPLWESGGWIPHKL